MRLYGKPIENRSDSLIEGRTSKMSGFGIGNYPPEYNPKIHGPYDPSRFYGKADKPLSQVKVGEVTSWLSRRSFHPLDMGRAMGRGYWGWANKWLFAKKAGAAPLIHLCLGASLLYYLESYSFLKYHKHCKYH